MAHFHALQNYSLNYTQFIVGTINTNLMPLVNVILSDKFKDTCRRMFVALNSIKFKSKLFMWNFEKITIMLWYKFTQTHKSNVVFHLGKYFWRHIKSLSLQKKYSEDSEDILLFGDNTFRNYIHIFRSLNLYIFFF
jgi:hypothetical protein